MSAKFIGRPSLLVSGDYSLMPSPFPHPPPSPSVRLSSSNQYGISLSQLRGLNKIPTLTLSSLPLPAIQTRSVRVGRARRAEEMQARGLGAVLLPRSLLEEALPCFLGEPPCPGSLEARK